MSVTIDNGPMDGPDQITPEHSPKRSFGEHVQHITKAFTTKQGLVGTYDYGFLFKPNLPFMRKSKQRAPFFGLQDRMPVVLALLLGFQHALAMLAGIITPPIIISGSANFDTTTTQYLVSTSLIVCVATKGLSQMYENGMCPTAADGTQLPCPEGYGAILGTASLCALLEIGLSFMTPSLLKKLFPPIVTGPTVTLIGVSLIESGLQGWAGGSGSCMSRPTTGDYMLCPSSTSPHALPWGSAQFIGLGFSVFVTIIIFEKFGAPIMKSLSVVLGLLVGCIIAAATGYFDSSSITSAPAASFVWVHTFKLSVYGPLILPLMAVYLILMMEAIGDITATCDVSRLQVDGKLFDSRIQGGILADGINGMLAGLCTITPMSTFAQNNGVIALTRCANRKAGYAACFFLIIMGIFSKFAAALTAIPSSVLGGMTTFLFASVAVSGIRIIATVPFTRRTRFILTASMSLGFGAILVPNWFSYVFTYTGDNKAKAGFFDAIVLVMETGFAVTAFVAVILNLMLADEDEAEETESLAGDLADREQEAEMDEEFAEKSAAVSAPTGSEAAVESKV
ncbi:hypothetical protein G7Y89_g6255 [Cudoniella acicularis]|uniref:Purine permease n=1 Tax=Cudoniella acicularis TaxID=354080 RepID=A0A8H4RMK7_9HELO|nr:hypothetical protein G7Y89_g6255 [Cudoniella acicularis]